MGDFNLKERRRRRWSAKKIENNDREGEREKEKNSIKTQQEQSFEYSNYMQFK